MNSKAEGTTVAGKRVLIVDDDPALLVAFREALRLRMPEVETDVAESGSHALKLLDSNDYDAIISDIKMPGMDGLALLTEISNRKPDIPTLLITGHGQQDLAVRALRGGAFDFIQKPIDRNYITVALTRAFQVRQLKRQIDCQRRSLEEHAAGLEVAVQQRTEELVRANQAKDEFLAMLAHELRNPLASISTAASLLSFCDAKSDPHEEALAVVERQVKHMTRLLDDLLDVSRITRKRIKLYKQTINLAEVVQAAADSMQAFFKEAGQHFSLKLPPRETLTMIGDPTRLEQVIVNLLNNAAKYTDRGGHVTLTVEKSENWAIISVDDTGIGIAADMLPRIFDLFSQADRSLDRSQGGLGIGLTLVRKLVEFHAGSVDAYSDGEGRGSRFVVRLPLVPVAAPETPPAPPRQSTASRRVLLVEDNAPLVQMTSMLLSHCGHEVVAVATDGLAAIDAVHNHDPEVVLLDIGLPKLDGYEVARRLRACEEFRDLILIAMTGYGREEDHARSREAGFNYHVVKPVTLEILHDLLSSSKQSQLRFQPAVS